ncbi:hypothetical protein Bca4012_058540 [Brassica carinata]|uniref:Transmembrane 9 superfamily member n=1 Tax=Brassica carinata TaxID=52824 RepID=A0A8X7W4T1_BRACI|nr:hypothetical protein Bca52824_016272 [Brassica carinata]
MPRSTRHKSSKHKDARDHSDSEKAEKKSSGSAVRVSGEKRGKEYYDNGEYYEEYTSVLFVSKRIREQTKCRVASDLVIFVGTAAMDMELRRISETSRSAIVLILLLFVHVAHSFYHPGVAPQDFEKGDELKVKVNKLTSIKTQLPYSYYSLPFCQPKKIVDSTENLGEVLRGDRIENAPCSFKMREAQMCNVLCRVKEEQGV